MAAKAFPKALYVKWEEDGDDSFLLCAEDAANYAVPNGKVRVGVYELKVATTVTANVEVA